MIPVARDAMASRARGGSVLSPPASQASAP